MSEEYCVADLPQANSQSIHLQLSNDNVSKLYDGLRYVLNSSAKVSNTSLGCESGQKLKKYLAGYNGTGRGDVYNKASLYIADEELYTKEYNLTVAAVSDRELAYITANNITGSINSVPSSHVDGWGDLFRMQGLTPMIPAPVMILEEFYVRGTDHKAINNIARKYINDNRLNYNEDIRISIAEEIENNSDNKGNYFPGRIAILTIVDTNDLRRGPVYVKGPNIVLAKATQLRNLVHPYSPDYITSKHVVDADEFETVNGLSYNVDIVSDVTKVYYTISGGNPVSIESKAGGTYSGLDKGASITVYNSGELVSETFIPISEFKDNGIYETIAECSANGNVSGMLEAEKLKLEIDKLKAARDKLTAEVEHKEKMMEMETDKKVFDIEVDKDKKVFDLETSKETKRIDLEHTVDKNKLEISARVANAKLDLKIKTLVANLEASNRINVNNIDLYYKELIHDNALQYKKLDTGLKLTDGLFKIMQKLFL